MEQFLQLFILLPAIAAIFSFIVPNKKETIISGIAITVTGIQLIATLLLVAFWLLNSHPTLDFKHIVFYKVDNIEIFIDFYFDKTTAAFAVVGSVLSFLVSVFSKYYLHREEGFKRFFITLLFFFLGYNLVIFSGNFETLFIGWEILGFTSFLLIAFYRDRYLPVKNGLKVISIYRLGDICLILVMWMSHHLWHENITFLKLNDLQLVAVHVQENYWYVVFISAMLLIAAAAKSAQLPFSSWLPRAMEGPTTSTAIFYGSLSAHIGVFLLLRTYPYWEGLAIIKIMVIAIGACTTIVATSIARVQSTVKTQIAYSSITQIGLIFIEVALGFHVLALFHFAANAFLRTYQLLVSPSVLSYLVHDMVFNFKPKNGIRKKSLLTKLENSLYILSVKEWNLDMLLFRFLWSPFKSIGKNLGFLSNRTSLIILAALYILGTISIFYQDEIHPALFEFLPFLFSFTGLLLILNSFSQRGDAIKAWSFIIAGQLFITLSISLLNEKFGVGQVLFFLSGSVISAVVGYICLNKIKSIDNNIDLNRYHGYIQEQPRIGFVFLLACLGLIGMPFTPTFIGIDLLFNHIHKHQQLLIVFTALSFLFMELAILRIYIRIFLGQHKKTYHPMAFKYS